MNRLWEVLEKEDKIDLQDAIKKAGLPPYEGRMAVRAVLEEFTLKWKKLIWRKSKIKELAKSDLFGKIILLEKCEDSKVTPEGLDLKLWFEKLRYNKAVRVENPLFNVHSPVADYSLTYGNLVEVRNGVP